MSVNEHETMETEFNKLNISNNDSIPVNNQKNCSYCNKPLTEKLWCKECDPRCIIERWTSGNPDIDKLIKDTIYNARKDVNDIFLEWVSFDRLTDIKQIGRGGFSEVYSATWIDGNSSYYVDNENWKKSDPKPIKVALRALSKISSEYLNEVVFYFI